MLAGAHARRIRTGHEADGVHGQRVQQCVALQRGRPPRCSRARGRPDEPGRGSRRRERGVHHRHGRRARPRTDTPSAQQRGNRVTQRSHGTQIRGAHDSGPRQPARLGGQPGGKRGWRIQQVDVSPPLRMRVFTRSSDRGSPRSGKCGVIAISLILIGCYISHRRRASTYATWSHAGRVSSWPDSRMPAAQ